MSFMSLIDAELMKILACPKCHGDLQEEVITKDSGSSGHAVDGRLICAACRLAYPVRDGIPVMLIDEAQPL